MVRDSITADQLSIRYIDYLFSWYENTTVSWTRHSFTSDISADPHQLDYLTDWLLFITKSAVLRLYVSRCIGYSQIDDEFQLMCDFSSDIVYDCNITGYISLQVTSTFDSNSSRDALIIAPKLAFTPMAN